MFGMNTTRYSALPTSHESLSLSGEQDDIRGGAPKKRSTFDRFLSWATVGTILITLLSLGILAKDVATPKRRMKVLRRPSPFPNPDWLREAARIHNRTFDPIINIAPLSFQMKARDRRRRLVEDYSREHDTPQGRVWPDDRHFVVSGNTSTVMQFRNRDFDMEKCVLTIVVPQDTPSLIAAANVQHGSKLNVWMLDNALEIHPAISWGYAPERRSLLTSLEVTDGTFTSAPFRCASTSFTTLELECADRTTKCLVDFWQDRQKPYAGVYIVQHHASPTDSI